MEYKYKFTAPLIASFVIILFLLLLTFTKLIGLFHILDFILLAFFALLILFLFFRNYRKLKLENNHLIVYYWLRPRKVLNLKEVKNVAIKHLKILTKVGKEPHLHLWIEITKGKIESFAFRSKEGETFAKEIVKKFESLGGKSKQIDIPNINNPKSLLKFIGIYLILGILYFIIKSFTRGIIFSDIVNFVITGIILTVVVYLSIKNNE